MKITNIIDKKIAVYCSTPEKAEKFINECKKINIQLDPRGKNRGMECFTIRAFHIYGWTFTLFNGSYNEYKERDDYQIINCDEIEFATLKPYF